MKKLPGIGLFDLSERCAIVTGGSKGLGLAMAAGLASAGASVMLVSRNPPQAQQSARELQEIYGIRAYGFAADVTIESEVKNMISGALSYFKRIDILINSAGINIRGPIDQLTIDQFNAVIRTNVNGTWLCSREVVPHLKEQRHGRIINLASTLGVVGLENRTPYTASKGAVVQMTRALGLELAPFGINVNAICPGPFLTEMNEPIADTPEGDRVIDAVALKRWGRLEEIQGAAIFLASDAASFMVGSLVTVDGGWTAR